MQRRVIQPWGQGQGGEGLRDWSLSSRVLICEASQSKMPVPGSLCAPGPAGIHKYVIEEMTMSPKSGSINYKVHHPRSSPRGKGLWLDHEPL